MKISNRLLVLLLAVLSITLFSCQKQIDLDDDILPGGNPPGGTPGTTTDIKGAYNFLNMTVHGKSTLVASVPGITEKVIYVTNYITNDNVGTITIDATKMTSAGIGFTIDTISDISYYSDGQLVDSLQMPFSYTQSPYGATSNYNLVSSDSLYLTGGFMNAPDGSGTTTPTLPSGARYGWAGDTLILTMKVNQKQSQVVNGITANIEFVATQVLKMKKK